MRTLEKRAKPLRTGAWLPSLVALLVVATACGGSATQSNFAANGTFSYALDNDPGNLPPYQTLLTNARLVDTFAYDSLVSIKSDGSIGSALATKWSATATGATFTLHSGVTCSDGHKLTPSDIVADFNYIKDPVNKSPALGVLIPTPNFTATGDDSANTLTITLKQPFGFTLQTFGTLAILCPQGLQNPSTLLHNSNGTGPYEVSDAVPADHYNLTLRKGYTWGPNGVTSTAPGLPTKVTFKVVPNQSTRVNLLLAGNINASGVVGPDRQRVDNKGLAIQKVPVLLGELFFNEAAGRPGADQAVRTALTTAMDLASLRKVATGGLGLTPTGLVTIQPAPCSGNTVAGNLPAYSVAKAQLQLDQAGWTAGGGSTRAKAGKPLSLTVLYPSSVGGVELGSSMELLAGEWKAVGADVSLKGTSATDLTGTLFGGGNWDAAVVPIGVRLPSMLVGFFSGPTPPSGTNFASINNSEYSSNVAAAAAAGPGGCPQWNAAEAALFKAANVVPFASDSAWVVCHKCQFQLIAGGLVPTSVRLLQ